MGNKVMMHDERIEQMKINLIAMVERATFHQLEEDFLKPAKETLRMLEEFQGKNKSLKYEKEQT